MRFIRKAGAPAEKSPDRLLVDPAELARKLAKEMDDHAVSRGDYTLVRNRYIIYLCPDDYENLAPRRAQVTADLVSKLGKHARDRNYRVQGDLIIEMTQDPDLELGYFGILAQRAYADQVLGEMPGHPAAPGAPPAAGGIADAAPAAQQAAAAAAAAHAAASVPAPAAGHPGLNIPANTEVLPAKQAENLGLAHRVIVITAGDKVQEFTQSRVVLGRSKEVDLRIDDPNVSRRHAAVYWNDGRLVLEDLGSTNGTLVNGYPVTSTILGPRDVVAIGDSRLTVESK